MYCAYESWRWRWYATNTRWIYPDDAQALRSDMRYDRLLVLRRAWQWETRLALADSSLGGRDCHVDSAAASNYRSSMYVDLSVAHVGHHANNICIDSNPWFTLSRIHPHQGRRACIVRLSRHQGSLRRAAVTVTRSLHYRVTASSINRVWAHTPVHVHLYVRLHFDGVSLSSFQAGRLPLWGVYIIFEPSTWSEEHKLALREFQRDMGECAAFSLLLPSFAFDTVLGSLCRLREMDLHLWPYLQI